MLKIANGAQIMSRRFLILHLLRNEETAASSSIRWGGGAHLGPAFARRVFPPYHFYSLPPPHIQSGCNMSQKSKKGEWMAEYKAYQGPVTPAVSLATPARSHKRARWYGTLQVLLYLHG